MYFKPVVLVRNENNPNASVSFTFAQNGRILFFLWNLGFSRHLGYKVDILFCSEFRLYSGSNSALTGLGLLRVIML